MPQSFFELEERNGAMILRLHSGHRTNRLACACVAALTGAVARLRSHASPLLITGNDRFFSAGADLREISGLSGRTALEFSRTGQALMSEIEHFPAPVYAAISGYCMGGGLDLALACHHRVAGPDAILAHRGPALGLITGWGGTQRLPRLIGKAQALHAFVTGEKLSAESALRLGLVEALAKDPVAEAMRRIGA